MNEEEIVSRNPNKYYSKISVKDTAGIVEEFNNFGEDEKPIRFCMHCRDNNIHNVLGARLDYDERDKDDWLQCIGRKGCGRIYARYQSKVESSVKDFVEPSSNQFDEGKSIVSLDNKKRLTPTQKARQKQRDRIEQEPDEDIKRELRKGLQVDTIEDSMNY